MNGIIQFLHRPLVFRGMLLCMAIAFVVMFFVRVKLMTHYTLNMGGVDQNVIHGTLRIMMDVPLYGDPEEPPFPVVQYSPIFFYIHALACNVAGVGVEDIQGIYVVGRGISLLFNLFTCWLIMFVCRRMGLSRYFALAAAAFFFTSLTDMYFLRPDSLYMLFFWCHVAVVIRSINGGKQAWGSDAIIFSSLFAVLALMTKQTGLIIPVMTGGLMLLQRQWKAFFQFAIACAIWLALFLALLFTVNDPEAVYKNIVLGNVNGTDLAHLIEHLTNRYGWPVLAWLVVGTIVALDIVRKKGHQAGRYIAFSLLVTLIWALFTALKRGSNTNYYTESQMFGVILCMVLLVEVDRHKWKNALLVLIMVFMPVTSLLRSAMFFNATIFSQFRADEPAQYFSEMELSRRIREHGLASDEYVFLLGRGYSEMFLAPHTLWNAKCIILVSDEYLAFDLTQFYGMAEDGRMKYVIASSDRYPLEFYGRRLNGFEPLFELDGRTVYINQKQ